MIAAALVAGVPVDDVTMDETVDLVADFIDRGRADGRTFQIATVNVDFVVNARRDGEVLQILQRAELCLPDGMPIVWHAGLDGVRLRERVAGADLVPRLAARAETTGWRILLFGSKEGVAESAAELLRTRHPDAVIAGIAGPFMRDVREMDAECLDEIVAFRPDIVCVALGNPKQERWITAHRDAVGAPVLIGVGGTLDFLVGGRRRAPEWMRRTGLEWVYRALQEPGRLGKRYAHDGWVFAPLFARAVWGRVRHRAPAKSFDVVVRADDHLVDLAGAALSRRDVAALVAVARAARRAGLALRLVNVSSQAVAEFRHLDVVKMFVIA